MWNGGIYFRFFRRPNEKKWKAKRKRLRRIDGASFVISVSISCGESGEKSKLRRDSDGLFSFVSYQYCQRQNNKGRQQNKAGVQNNHAVHIRTGESGTGGLCEVRCSCIGKELSHQTFLLSWRWTHLNTHFFTLQGGKATDYATLDEYTKNGNTHFSTLLKRHNES